VCFYSEKQILNEINRKSRTRLGSKVLQKRSPPRPVLIQSRMGVCVIVVCASKTVRPNIARRPLRISAWGVSPGTILGISPEAGSCSSPLSRYNLSWKDRGATAAHTEKSKRCRWPARRLTHRYQIQKLMVNRFMDLRQHKCET
jgi:hypothetical protein